MQLDDKEFGRIEIHRNNRATRIRITIKPDCLRITLPPRASAKEGLDFLERVRPEIARKRQKVAQKQQVVLINKENPLRTISFTTQVQATKRDKVFFLLKNNILHIEYPEGKDCNSEQMQQYFRNGIDFFLRKEAKRLLPERLAHLAKTHGFKFTDIKIQSSKTRWGSCSSRGSINLSYFLLTLPPHLVDYVLLHELCHTVEMNHGNRFWELMDKVTSNQSKSLRREMKRFTTQV